jgi:predicted O-linked N-acetylglucosamine transferase (SPINDLY family)
MHTSDDPTQARINALFQQAVAHFQRGDLSAALSCAENVLKLAPRHADALHLAAIVQTQLGQYPTAIELFHRALALIPQHPGCHSNLGFALRMAGRLDEARAACARAIQLKPNFADAHNMLGVVLKDLGRPEEALAACTRATQLRADFAEAHNTLGVILKDLGRLEEAAAACVRAVRIRPGFAEAHNALGVILKSLGRPDEALASFARALEIRPDFAEAHDNRGSLLAELGRITDGLAACERALRINPQLAKAHYNRANILANLGRFEAAEAGYRRALSLDPGHAVAHSNLLFLLAAEARLSPEEMLEQQRQWDRAHGAAGRAKRLPPRAPEPLAGRRLRIGYVSPDFRRHPVGYFVEPLLAAHDTAGFEVFCYASHDDATQSDAVTQRLRDSAEHWRFVRHLDDPALARLIRDDAIDILIDLAGHTEGNRLLAFTYRPAPIQAMYLGYCASSGLDVMDYWITDDVLHPPDTPERTSERIHRLPRCSFCFRPPEEAPPVAARPDPGERVTFGSFSHLSKLQPDVIATWSRILTCLPHSRLLLMDKHLADVELKRQLLQRFADHDIPPERLILHNRLPYEQYLATYAEVDLVLDPFPRTGGTTTAEALWMGVPVITLAGQRYVERISMSKLTALGLPALITHTRDEYVDTAVALAQDAAARQHLRSGLRERMAASPLCDGVTLARAMESAFRGMWQHCLAGADGRTEDPAATRA